MGVAFEPNLPAGFEIKFAQAGEGSRFASAKRAQDFLNHTIQPVGGFSRTDAGFAGHPARNFGLGHAIRM
jgi:hypothetical protein